MPINMNSYCDIKADSFNAEKKGKIICIYGESQSGKSYLAKELKKDNTIIFDGDGVRKYINYNLTHSLCDKYKNNQIIADIAFYLYLQGFDIIIATIKADIAYEILRNKGVENIELIKACYTG